MSEVSHQSYYDILEVSPDASRDEITRAYHRSKSAYSSTSPALYSVFSKEEAAEIIKLIDEAYSVLINQDQRRNYDQHLLVKMGGGANAKSAPSTQSTVSLNELPDFAPPLAQVAPTSRTSHTVNTVLSNRSVSAPRPTAAPVVRGTTPVFVQDKTFEAEIENCEYFDGAFLTRIREYKNVTLEQISDLTRVGKHYLKALEKNDLKALPASVFVRGFVVQYAKVLGLDERKTADSYMKILKEQSGK